MILLAPSSLAAVRLAIENALGMAIPETFDSLEELAAWAATRASLLATAVLNHRNDPADRVTIAEFVGEFCRSYITEATELVAASDSVLDLVAFAEQLLELATFGNAGFQMVVAKRPGVWTWIAYVAYRDHHEALGETDAFMIYCRQMIACSRVQTL